MIKHTESHKFDSRDKYKITVGTGREDIKIFGQHLDVKIESLAKEEKDQYGITRDSFTLVEIILKISGNIDMSRTQEEWFNFWEAGVRERQTFQQIKVLGKE